MGQWIGISGFRMFSSDGAIYTGFVVYTWRDLLPIDVIQTMN